MKFIADVMLGKLAKKMRLLGFDVLYDRTLNDREIIRLSLKQHRLILTRDTALLKRPLASNHCLIKKDMVRDQLDQLFSELSLPPSVAPLSRCSLCNEPLISIARQDVQDVVPLFVYENKESFFRCQRCERIYWKGSHVRGKM
jgi:uncharacterized protein